MSKLRITGSLSTWMPDWQQHRPDCPTLLRLRAAGLSCAAPVVALTERERVRAALMAGPRFYPAATAPPTPTPVFLGKGNAPAPPPVDLASRIKAAAEKRGVR